MRVRWQFSLLLVFLLFGAVLAPAQTSHKMTKADIDRWMTELSNWGRWGKDDQLGTLNLITPAKRKEAAALVKEGYSISLAHDVLTEKAVDNESPFVHTMLPPNNGFQIDNYSVSFHGMGQTHLDALCHVSYQGRIFNGFRVDQINASGCPKDSIIVAKTGILTRGVLMDFARFRGVDYLKQGTPIYPEDLEAWERQTGVKVSVGDALLIRTGRWAMRAKEGPGKAFAGLHASCAKWLHDRGVAVLGGDADPEVYPSQVEGVAGPIHLLAIVSMGMLLFDECDFEDLGREAAKRKRWVFLFTAVPIAVPGGTGSPINPIATY
jgi:kynurenine formamidase